MENDLDCILRLEHITKEFPGVKALDDVHLSVKKGEVHALIGENGAGKSTLMKCIIGMYKPTSGKIWFDGNYIEDYSIIKALHLGISMIHQELSPVSEKSIMENIWLGREPKNKFGFIDHKKMEDMTKAVLDKINLEISPRILMKELTVATTQMIEIAKALSFNAKVIIMDEPTSSLTEKEVKQLYKIIRDLKKENVSIIYISHKLDEIMEICDELTVFRDGQYITQRPVSEINEQELINLMVGRDVTQLFPKTKVELGPVKLSVKNFSNEKDFKNISFEVREGEILGFAGLVGAGRSEVMEALFGVRHKLSGEVTLNGKELHITNASSAVKSKLAFLTENRRKTGIFPMLSVNYNIVSSSIGSFKNKIGLLNNKRLSEESQAYIDLLNVKTPTAETAIENLSGGNQQKVLIAKWLLTRPEILILDEPTRGIDVGAKAEIHRNISTMAATGKGIIMVSSELPEILGMSDRVIVMHEGKITGNLINKNLTQEDVIAYASGLKNDFS
ncbi:sugar ABC transporter ATP-binding protein [Vagococcus sp. PNs007]|uniref:Ribose/galactose/methyl galactoside import ATP-binding protein n=1 Tax=Vagococcus proximus TaxID=2991417 RepID=A0ABT5X2D3_9ENTE|nr:sugar ABC transporter ATP-binding protein [Vagococcus proximus]MDF0480064.1 sugar ABC transporter ATP-binding protein [Vagococcus proximus]